MKKSLGVAVIGCGQMGTTIIEGIIDMPEVGKLAAFDVNKAQIEAAKKRFPQVIYYNTLEEVLEDKTIELIYVASSNSTHVPIVCAALRAGKAVMSEKPSGVTIEEINELERVYNETGGFLQIGLECRYSWAYKAAKEIIDSGEIGKVNNIHFTYSMPPWSKKKKYLSGEVAEDWRVTAEGSGNMYLEKLCHYIDLVRWWNEGSRIDKYIVTSSDNVIPHYEIEDNVQVTYHFDNGCVSHLYFIMTAAPGHNNDLMDDEDLFIQDKLGHKLNYVISGTEGAIEIDVFQREVRVYHHPGKEGRDSGIIARKINWTDRLNEEGFSENLYFHNTYEQNRDIIKRVLNGDKPSISVSDAQETMRICMEFADAHKNRRWELIER